MQDQDTNTERVAIVTGAGGGIGRAICVKLAAAGWTVVAADLNAVDGEATAQQCRDAGAQAFFRSTDVTDAAQMQALVDTTQAEHGRVDGFVNNAGYEGTFASMADYPDDVFDRVIAVNLRGVFLGLKHALRVMQVQRSGVVVNLGSTSSIRGRKNVSAYVASKHGVLGLTRAAALEVAGTGIRVNAVLPGPIDTAMTVKLDGLIEEAVANGTSAGLGRNAQTPYGQPAEIAGAVAFLMSADAAHITGTSLTVDAGSTVS